MYMKKLCASNWLKTSAFSSFNTSIKLEHECKLQIACPHIQKFVCLDFLRCFFMKIIHQFCCLQKIYQCLLTPSTLEIMLLHMLISITKNFN